jgi:hypothetical protein
MAGTTQRTDPALWDRIKAEVTAGDKGGHAGEWSARKAQMAVQRYKAAGGGYKGRKNQHNHLGEWTREEWGTKSGGKSLESGERYLPKAVREKLTEEEHARTTAKKRADLAAGRQHSTQPRDVAAKAADMRLGSLSKTELMKRAATQGVDGRSRMTKDQLLQALARHK